MYQIISTRHFLREIIFKTAVAAKEEKFNPFMLLAIFFFSRLNGRQKCDQKKEHSSCIPKFVESEGILAIQLCLAEDSAFSSMMYMSLFINSERPVPLETRVNRGVYWIRSLL